MPKTRKNLTYRDLNWEIDQIEAKRNEWSNEINAYLSTIRDRAEGVCQGIEIIQKSYDDEIQRIGEEEAAYELAAVVNALKAQKKIVIDVFEWDALKKLEKDQVSEKESKKRKLSSKVDEKVKDKIRFKDVEFKSKFAEMDARDKAFEAERKNLTQTIEAMRIEIDSQKRLTGNIARATTPVTIAAPSKN